MGFNSPTIATLLAALWAIDLAWAASAGLTLSELGMMAATLLVLAVNLLVYRRIRNAERTREMLLGITAFITLGSGFTLLSYLGLTLQMPFADAWFARADAALGFDWPAWFRFVRTHALLTTLLAFAYRSMMPQMLITLIALPLSGMAQRGREFIWATGLALLPTVVLSALLPAESAWVWHHSAEAVAPGPLRDVLAMREGRLTVLDLAALRGLVTFPSFHVIMAVLLVWAARGTRFARLSLALNALMIAATPSEGGHYLVDAIGGVAVGIAGVAGAHRIVGSSLPPAGKLALEPEVPI